MESLKKFGAGILDSVSQNRNKPPPDDLMVSCKAQLTDLRDEIMVVKQQFSQYAHQVVEASEASVTLSKSVDRFYSKANHPGRSESVNMYKKVQEDIANSAVKTFHITVENGLISELGEWIQLVANLSEKISAAESTRLSAHDTQNRLQALQNEYTDKKGSKKGIFGRNNQESDLEELQHKISESTEAKKSLTQEYANQRSNIATQVKQLMEKRYRYFDRIYVQMLECQSEYFQHAATVSKRFQRDIDYYRKQYPKTEEFHMSNVSATDLGGFNDEGTGLLSAQSNDNGRASNTRPKVPTNKPPKAKTKNARKNSKIKGFIDDSIPQTNTTETKQNTQSKSSKSTPKQTPKQTPQTMSQPNMNGNANHDTIQNDVHYISENPNDTLDKPHPYGKQGSTHDILNLGGPMSPQQSKPVPKIQKQDSLMTSLFGGNTPTDNNNNSNVDHHGLFNLSNPDQNDMLGGFEQKATMKPLKEQQKSGDPFDDFDNIFGGGGGGGGKPKHRQQDSFLSGMFNDSSETKVESKSQNNGDLSAQMGKAFNAPSYQNGHGHSNGNGSPQLKSSKTGKAGNGASAKNTTHINNKDLSESDKQQMASMKLSKKGQIAAQRQYEEKMARRKEEEERAQQMQREKRYWKEQHEAKLKHWEFDNTIRRNIRVLIGKLPEVLSPELKWKPIPMTKLLNDAQLKKGYYKAVRVVHPDKSTGRGDSVEDQVVCDYVFQALEQAFNTKFG